MNHPSPEALFDLPNGNNIPIKPRREKVAITAQIEELAASLGVQDNDDPDAFVAAIKARHDQLVRVTEMLNAQNQRQAARQVELDAREKALILREKRANAIEELTSKGKSSWWRLGG